MVDYKNELNGMGGGSGGGGGDSEQFRKLFIGGLSINTTDESLRQYYSQFGQLDDCVVMRDPQTKRSRCFGFVSFSDRSEVDRAMDARPHEIDGKVVDPKRAVPRDQSSRAESNISTKRLYVSGVRDEHTEEEFRQHFSQYGGIEKVEIIMDKATNKPRGFAFVNFDDYDPVDKCVLIKSHMISGYRCDVKKALSKDEMGKAAQVDREREMRGARSRGQQRGPYGGRGGGGGGGGYGNYGGGYGNQWAPHGPPQQWASPQQQWGPQAGYAAYSAYGSPAAGGYGPPAAEWGGQAAAAWPASAGAAAWAGATPAAGAATSAQMGQWSAAAGGGQQQWGAAAGAGGQQRYQ